MKLSLLVNVIRAALLAAGVLASTLLVSCGGGDRVEDFVPKRLLVFGDETSVIDDTGSTANGRKYTVNALAADNVTLDCANNPIWIQYVASTFGLVLPECNPTSAAEPQGRIYAEPGDKVVDVVSQIDSHLLADTFYTTDLVTVLAGANDILELYALYDGSNEATLTLAAQAAGSALAGQVNRIANAGGKVLIATVPDLGFTPFAVTENTANAGRAALLSRLTLAFNERVRAGIQNNGRKIGLLLADEQVQTLAKFPNLYGLANVTTPACDPLKAPSVEQCSTQTLVTDGSPTTYLWADATHLSPAGHRSLGLAASTRATNNPF